MAGSKKYKGKLCVYCRVNNAATADHVFPREFFQVEHRNQLPKVPACSKCNNEKSKLEHYLTTVLPFGGTHIDSQKALEIDVPKRLSKNRKLSSKLHESMSDIFVQSVAGSSEKRLGFGIDIEKLHALAGYIGRGLIWYHWKIYLPEGCIFKAFTPSSAGMEFLTYLFNLSTEYRVNTVSLGVDTIRYKGVMSQDNSGLSIWAVQFLGGLTLVDESSNSVFENSFVAVITGSPSALSNLELDESIT
ncbi:HNH endonuclease [Vibrio cholerae]|uniref:HNH endonuclease n=1 Tax=Vibrio cholerae TaxID=666 RepID=UPI00115A2379|nr:HNH endonuclease [Vibrio cholerae]TQO83690.1 HNH endonuclease [Vibrio cholerae]TQP01894.1 HNH endonuclease [Vibrio cholerae]TQP11136.1 HNH endonuclease [Vibrio cholerae]TQP31976.1 HNH endonuclease [Vibrio cholerae]TQP45441.1 HNH endonuclease [Vibrio cholerae]